MAWRRFGVLVSLACLTTACLGDGGGSTATTATTSVTTAGPTTAPSTAPSMAPSTAATTAPSTTSATVSLPTTTGGPTTTLAPVSTTTAPSTPGAGACAPASWRLDAATFYDALNRATGAAVQASGTFRMDLLADGSARFVYEGVQLGFTGDVRATANGPVTATYQLNGDTLTASGLQSSVDLQVTVAGTSIDGGPIFAGMLQSLPFSGVRVACDAARLTVTYVQSPLAGVTTTWAKVA